MILILKKKAQASLTVEAAFILPIFLYLIIIFLYFFQIMTIQEKIQMGITEAAREISQYTYIYKDIIKNNIDKQENNTKYVKENQTESNDKVEEEQKDLEKDILKEYPIVSSLLGGTFLKLNLQRYINPKELKNTCIKGGYSGISFLHSSILEQDDIIDIICVYRVKIPVPFIFVKGFTMVQRVKTRGFVGTTLLGDTKYREDVETGEGKQEIVYITEHGIVYHESLTCSHIKLSIQYVLFEEVEQLRNESGGKYKKCQLCVKNEKPSIEKCVYIAKDGDRFHNTISCSGLKRTIITIKKSEINGREPCKRCGLKGE